MHEPLHGGVKLRTRGGIVTQMEVHTACVQMVGCLHHVILREQLGYGLLALAACRWRSFVGCSPWRPLLAGGVRRGPHLALFLDETQTQAW